MAKKPILSQITSLWLLVALGLIIIVIISFAEDITIGDKVIRKGTFKETLLAEPIEEVAADVMATDSILLAEETKIEPDTTVKTVFLFGDSMTILLARRMAAYGVQNGYKVADVTWDGSSSIGWTKDNSLDEYLAKYKPDFVIISLGGNEIYFKSKESRIPYLDKLLKKLGNIPFIWVGPPDWKDDQKPYSDMLEEYLPKGTFFRSSGLDLKRGPDKIHPVQSSANVWVDSIMRWMPKSAHPILSEFPDSTVKNPPLIHTHIKAGAKK